MKRLILPFVLMILVAGVILVSCGDDEYVDTFEDLTETEESTTTTKAKPTTTKVMPTWQAAPTTTTTKPTTTTRATLPTKKVIPTLPTTPTTTTARAEPPVIGGGVEDLPPVTATPTPDDDAIQNQPGSGSEFELPLMPAEQTGFVGFLVDVLG